MSLADHMSSISIQGSRVLLRRWRGGQFH